MRALSRCGVPATTLRPRPNRSRRWRSCCDTTPSRSYPPTPAAPRAGDSYSSRPPDHPMMAPGNPAHPGRDRYPGSQFGRLPSLDRRRTAQPDESVAAAPTTSRSAAPRRTRRPGRCACEKGLDRAYRACGRGFWTYPTDFSYSFRRLSSAVDDRTRAAVDKGSAALEDAGGRWISTTTGPMSPRRGGASRWRRRR